MDRERPSADASFRKACGYLNYNAQAKWTAHIAGVGTALVYVALLTTLWLFTDLMVSRGRVPELSDLTRVQTDWLADRWDNATPEEKSEWAKAAGFDQSAAAPVIKREWVALTPEQQERLWITVVELALTGVDDAAVDRVIRPDPDHKLTEVVGKNGTWRRIDPADHGLLSLTVREYAQGASWTPTPWMARYNGWLWNASSNEDTLFPTSLTGLFLIAVVLGLIGVILTIVMREAAAAATIEATTRLRRAVYHHTFRLGTLAIKALGPSEAVSILTRHIEALHDALYARLTVHYRAPITFGLLLLFALVINWKLALAFVLFAVIVWAIALRIVAYFRVTSNQASNQAAERLTIIRESLMLMRLVKVFLMEQFNQARIERQLSRYSQVQRIRYRGENLALPLLVLLGGFCALVLVYVGALLILQGFLSIASAVALVTTLGLLFRPVERWLKERRVTKRGREAAEHVFTFLDRRGEVGQVVGAEFLPPLAKQLEFDNVTLRDASTGRKLLDEVSLTIPAGQRIGLVGADNLEKHALVYLIPRLLDPTGGEVRIDQHNLRWVTLDSLRNQIGVVMMHNLVFHDTVANNIGCGDKTFSLPQIIEAAKIAHAHHFIQKLPQGYETPIGELGHTLSTSQQFRIALARAILRDPALLIIEEPEGELDDDTKNLLDDTLARILPGRTAVFLPHRISTLRSCNTVYLMNKGRIEASGTHKELLGGNPLYKHLYYLEFNEFDEQM